ncbi:hypothetical protein Mgra_00000642 [Meloidogyne graminicola]|uniref:Uncharacterized protein n=1 Tax=Meloidogyne graminicola TaxID=189291 RepID=A0A8T0A102_9BILA|nr:hypothetical protein Mgra_00000642 [Meloidogyne graminicola]
MLMEALRDALQYVKVRNAQQEAASASKHLGMNISSQNEHFLQSLPTPSDNKNVTPVVSTQILAPPSKIAKSVTKKKVPAQKIAPRKELKTELITKEEEEESSGPDLDSATTQVAAPEAKSFVTNKRFRLSSTSSEVGSPAGYQLSSVKKSKSVTNSEPQLTEEEKQNQLELFPKNESPSRESTSGGGTSSTVTTNKQIPKKSASKHNGHLSSPMIDLPQNESEPMEFEQQGKSTSQQKHLIGTNFVTKPSLFELASSEDAHQHMRQIWEECDEDWFKEVLNTEFYQLDFRNGDLLTFNETEKLFLEVEKWIKMESITSMNSFRQMFYIAKYVLPELCTFAISKMQDTSMMDARRIYEERREKTKQQTGVNSSSPNFLNTLVMAASLKMAEEKNGGINEGK